jgi:hypothetical protein
VSARLLTKKRLVVNLAAFGFCIALTLFVDVFTNHIGEPRFDGQEYANIAANGLIGNDDVEAPFAYRIAVSTVAGATMSLFNTSVQTAFTLNAYVGAVLQLFGVFILARWLDAEMWPALVMVAVVGLSFAQVKFLLFDVYRPDHFAHGLFLLALLFLMRRRYLWLLIAVAVGLLFREFLLVPLAMFGALLIFERNRFTRRELALWFGLALLAFVIGFVLPRLFIEVDKTEQFLDPFNDPATISQLIDAPLRWDRDLNILFGVLAYFLPTLMLLTPRRARLLWAEMRPRWYLYATYIGVMAFLIMYGGSDLFRFVAYFFVLQVIWLALLLRADIARWEIVMVIIAMLIFNQILLRIPFPDIEAYLNFIGSYAYDANINAVIRNQLVEWVVWVALMNLLRLLLNGRRAAAPQTVG